MSELDARWAYLSEGAALAANLTHVARTGTMEQLAAALHALPVEQVEAAAFAAILLHAEQVEP